MDKKALWEEILLELAPVIGKAQILTFFKDSIILEVENGKMKIGVSSAIAFNFVKQRYEIKILETARRLIPEIKEMEFEVKGSLVEDQHPSKIDLKLFSRLDEVKGVRKVPNKQEVLMEDGMRSKMFNPNYALRNFIPGEENKLAYAACMAVAAKPGNIYNPLYFFGGVGLGKTHLLQGTGMEILRNHPGKNIVYMTSEKFTNEIVEAIGHKHTRSFKDRYRKVDCLIVDDIQFFGNKDTSQQEFFHTFNELYDAGKQIIVSSDRSPAELDGLEKRLTTRFSMGMVIEVLLPDFETRIAILNAKCRELEVLIDREVLEFIAFNVTGSIREMEGILVKAIAEAQLTQTNPTIRSVADAIRKINSSFDVSRIGIDLSKRLVVRTPEDVIDVVANYYKLPKTELISEVRKKEIMVPRQICMYLIREALSHSYETIGERFSGRNHTTVLHACNKIIGEMKENSKIMRDVNALRKEMGM
jgi:chromosomal replication initiator protein